MLLDIVLGDTDHFALAEVESELLSMTTSQQDLALIVGAAEANKELQSALTQRVDALTKQLKQLDLLIVSTPNL